MTTKNIVIYSLLFFVNAIFCMQQSGQIVLKRFDLGNARTVEEFVAQYMAPKELSDIIDNNLPQNFIGLNRALSFEWLPKYYLKTQMSRIMGSLFIRKIAQLYNLSICTPEKFFYHCKGRLFDAEKITTPAREYLYSANYLVVSSSLQKVNKPFNLKQIQDLYVLMMYSGYEDLHHDNVFNTDSGLVYIIDTEEEAFTQFSQVPLIPIIQKMKRYLVMDQQARDWLNSKKQELELK